MISSVTDVHQCSRTWWAFSNKQKVLWRLVIGYSSDILMLDTGISH